MVDKKVIPIEEILNTTVQKANAVIRDLIRKLYSLHPGKEYWPGREYYEWLEFKDNAHLDDQPVVAAAVSVDPPKPKMDQERTFKQCLFSNCSQQALPDHCRCQSHLTGAMPCRWEWGYCFQYPGEEMHKHMCDHTHLHVPEVHHYCKYCGSMDQRTSSE